ncbi:MAG: cytochrome c [Nitrospira sp.]|nr:cytochrome c [Nitrospira sp.]
MMTGMCVFTFSGQVRADSDVDQLANGQKVYVKYCAGCHGSEGKGEGYKILGADPADFTSPSIKQKSDTTLLNTIHEGNSSMPSWKFRLSEEDGRDVLAYIRSLTK